MSELNVVSKERHAGKTWFEPTGYAFIENRQMAPLLGRELVSMVTHVCCAFLRLEDDVVPVAILGLEPDINVMVDADGRWLGRHVPETFRHYPFRLVKQEDRLILCVDESSDLVAGKGVGKEFFNEEGALSEALDEKFRALLNFEQEAQQTKAACKMLDEQGLLEAWPMEIEKDGQRKSVEGFLRISETKLNQVPAETLVELRNSGGLLMAYCQLLSMQNKGLLGQLASRKYSEKRPQKKAESLDQAFLSDEGGNLNFENL